MDVVIKVLKPGIEDFLVADLNFINDVARILVCSQVVVENHVSSVLI